MTSPNPDTPVPSYRELLARRDEPAGSAWGVFGAHDEAGTINRLTARSVLAGRDCVRRGAVFNLDLPLGILTPWAASTRTPPSHHLLVQGHQRDDYVDGYFLQTGSQIDGLRHHRHPEHGFYNHARDEDVAVGSPTIGVQHWAESGIVGRGVLIDLDGLLEARGERVDILEDVPLPVGLLDDALAAQGTTVEPGDIVMIRTGWMKAYLAMDDAQRKEHAKRFRCSGLEASDTTVAWLWDHGVSLVAADNPAVESFPPRSEHYPWTPATIHPVLIAMLGMALGELWALDALADDCAGDGIYECMVVSSPLNLVGGVGSPANAVAIK